MCAWLTRLKDGSSGFALTGSADALVSNSLRPQAEYRVPPPSPLVDGVDFVTVAQNLSVLRDSKPLERRAESATALVAALAADYRARVLQLLYRRTRRAGALVSKSPVIP